VRGQTAQELTLTRFAELMLARTYEREKRNRPKGSRESRPVRPGLGAWRTISPMDGGGLGELIGVAAVGVGVLVGWLYGPQAEKKFDRIVNRVLVATLVGPLALLLPFVIWWAVTS
jgi:hypothetical protein